MDIWTYWENPKWWSQRYEYIDMCFETMDKHKGRFNRLNILTPDTVKDYIHTVPKRFYTLEKPGQRADYIRLALLNKYGGLWLDADNIILRSLDPLYSILEETGALWKGRKRGSYTGVVGFSKHNPIAKKILNDATKILESSDKHIFWTKLGPYLFDKQFKEGIKHPWVNIPGKMFYYFGNITSGKLCYDGDTSFLDDTDIIGLSMFNNRLVKKRKWFYKATKSEIINSNCIFSKCYTYSIDNN